MLTRNAQQNSNVIPIIQGDRFDGDIDYWPIFFTEFYEQILQNTNYNDENKLHCLKNSICYEAKRHIFNEKTLKNAITLLLQKYSSLNEIKENAKTKLNKIENLNTANELKCFLQILQNYKLNLKFAQENKDRNFSFITEFIYHKPFFAPLLENFFRYLENQKINRNNSKKTFIKLIAFIEAEHRIKRNVQSCFNENCLSGVNNNQNTDHKNATQVNINNVHKQDFENLRNDSQVQHDNRHNYKNNNVNSNNNTDPNNNFTNIILPIIVAFFIGVGFATMKK